MSEVEETKALAHRQPLGFEPTNVDEAWRIAGMLAQSQLLPDALKGKPSDVLVTLLAGRELGLSPMQSIRQVYVVKGKPMLSTYLKIAMVKRSPDCIYFKCIETTNEKATFETERKGEGKTTLSFTMADAKNAKLTEPSKSGEPSMYTKYPALMLRSRAGSQLADLVYPDVVGGIGTHEEIPEVERSRPPEQKLERVTAPPPPSTPKTTKPAPAPTEAEIVPEKGFEKVETKAETAPEPHDPTTGEVAEPPAGTPDAAAAELRAKMLAAPDLNALSALARATKEFPEDLQLALAKTYSEVKALLRAKATAATT